MKGESIPNCDALVLTSVVVQGFFQAARNSLLGSLSVSLRFLKGNSEAVKKAFLRSRVGNLGMHEPQLKCQSCLGGNCSSPSARAWLPEAYNA